MIIKGKESLNKIERSNNDFVFKQDILKSVRHEYFLRYENILTNIYLATFKIKPHKICSNMTLAK